MMKLIYLSEDFALARHALARWPHDEATLPERLKWFRISASAVYPFDDAQGRPCFLRLDPKAEKSAPQILAEMDFLAHLHAGGCSCMQPIPTADGLLLAPVQHQGETWYASAFTGVPGQPLADLPMNSMLAYAYGSALGRLHAASMQYRPQASCRSRAGVTRQIREALSTCNAPQAVREQLDDVTRQLDAMPRTPRNYGMIHGDFEPDNVFWDGSGCHVIDFGDAMQHFYAMDLLTALDEMEAEYHAAFMGGYRDACPESEATQAELPLMRRFRDLQSYARLLHCLQDQPGTQPAWMPQLVRRLEARRDELLQRICSRQDPV